MRVTAGDAEGSARRPDFWYFRVVPTRKRGSNSIRLRPPSGRKLCDALRGCARREKKGSPSYPQSKDEVKPSQPARWQTPPASSRPPPACETGERAATPRGLSLVISVQTLTQSGGGCARASGLRPTLIGEARGKPATSRGPPGPSSASGDWRLGPPRPPTPIPRAPTRGAPCRLAPGGASAPLAGAPGPRGFPGATHGHAHPRAHTHTRRQRLLRTLAPRRGGAARRGAAGRGGAGGGSEGTQGGAGREGAGVTPSPSCSRPLLRSAPGSPRSRPRPRASFPALRALEPREPGGELAGAVPPHLRRARLGGAASSAVWRAERLGSVCVCEGVRV